MQVWNGLKGTTDIEQYVNVLDQIQPTDIPKGASIYCVDLFLNLVLHTSHGEPSCVQSYILWARSEPR